MTSSKASYIIVGAGVFGVSTAYYLIKNDPKASVTLIDRDEFDADSRVAASWDWNKVIRADYDDIVYCQLGIEAQDIFRSDPLWKPYFHETGIYWMCRSDYAQEVIENYRKLGREVDLCAVPVGEARKMYGGIFEDADYTGVKEVLVNKSSGWAAAGDCLRAITRKTVEMGVEYIRAEVSTLQFDDNGRCSGVNTRDGNILTASHVVLCTGAYTSKLLELSAEASGLADLRTEGRIVAGGITTGLTQLEAHSHELYAAMPVGVQGYTAETGPFIGSLPPTKDGELKWWGQTIFKNTTEILPGRYISIPPPESEYAQWKVSERLKEDIQHARNIFYGEKTAHWTLEKHRICWQVYPQPFSYNCLMLLQRDAFTTSSDFIISPHSASKGLYIATCGSFHGWKFFPVLGKYVLQMMEGSLSPHMAEKWAWNRERPDPALNADWPRGEMKNLFAQMEQPHL